MSHGWQSDVPSARDQYHKWITAMSQCTADIKYMQQTRPTFHPLLIGLHWPSLPWGDEMLGDSALLSLDSTKKVFVEQLTDRYAKRISDTPSARAALTTIFTAALNDIAPSILPTEVCEAYTVLDREAKLGSTGAGAAPGSDREPFDSEKIFQASEEDAISFGGFDMGGLLAPLRVLSFWKMKERARRFGETGGFALLSSLQRVVAKTKRNVRFHLMGHSFGCIAVSAMLKGPDKHGSLEQPVNSVVLAQGAMSLWSYCSDIPSLPGQAGYFHPVITDGKIIGPIITTQSEFDIAVGRFYPLGAGIAHEVHFVPEEWPKYGALGTFGIRGPGLDIVDLNMRSTDASYLFKPGKIYNLECSQFIREGDSMSGAHSDIAHVEVAHAVWEAALI